MEKQRYSRRKTSPTVPLSTINSTWTVAYASLFQRHFDLTVKLVSVGLKRLSRALTDHDLQYQRFQVYELNFSQHPSGSDSLIQMVARDKIKNFPIYLPLAYFPILKVDENRLVHKPAYCHVFL